MLDVKKPRVIKEQVNHANMKSTTLYRCKYDKALYRCIDGETLETRGSDGEWVRVTENDYFTKEKIFKEY